MLQKEILLELHDVTMKKHKREVQEEIDEFINKVAILSQINHKNVLTSSEMNVGSL